MTRAFLGLGSNLGNRLQFLREGVQELPDVVACSRLYESAPVGGPGGQGPFLNLVVQLETELTARELLVVAQAREQEARRVRNERWGPRTLDVDVLWIDGVTVDEPDLIVPHPRMFERAFVLLPLRDLAPDLIPSGFVDPPPAEVRSIGNL
ncbi:MAG: 2-amino-4-hydroxy-6-hydroxymethyldihydropteridine diphosphokinase [Actinobacteria bacterium]|uniref:2-amino-4-hydroxy-6-hydroxymethyldihydropteridine diphosphokinase n=1 Tax=freshwater metagenome TaxID=449393 RepID=A0A6J7N999_9ZZZZ|nr:2-amino-4-hydroxy-6-hydroxymethyldihydropteridine diphosphokinase [Actinomycetota bacterium]MSW91486.1 2-amino-4-hydroxy-6-hydroxymethyldihydropteridine diphosphokinase [Actinomycetota bacterium]MSX88825.1 2-amino-4-hydroxy-6-hydroxymethyldihydropteridine diphosphokinase [Actinomycetota bacterium]MSY71666.1 2-amino-4-hydroxy-6-hydroxymethyldihydropteridine diphosphokinase [Actinomycetota bacterium]